MIGLRQLHLLVFSVIIIIDGGGGAKQEPTPAPVLRLPLSESQIKVLEEGGGQWYIVCGYRQRRGSRGSGSGLWSQTMSGVGEIVLVPHTRQTDGVEDCRHQYWRGYDEIEHQVDDKEDGGGRGGGGKKIELNKEGGGSKDSNRKNRDAAESEERRDDKTCSGSVTSTSEMGDWKVALQSLINIILFALLPILIRLGMLGHKGK